MEQLEKDTLESLFSASLQYDDSVESSIRGDNLPGDFIGKGKGTIKGKKINGRLIWNLYAENCAFLWIKEGRTPPPDKHLCNIYLRGYITTDDGDRISFEARGYGFRGFDPENSHIWTLTAALRFGTETEHYRYLNTRLGVWEGRFNEKKREAHYQAYLSGPG